MSGGHWGYLSDKIDEAAAVASASVRLLARIEHELDWGHSCDTCLACARRRTLLALDLFFDTVQGGAPSATVFADVGRLRGYCTKCLGTCLTWGYGRTGDKPTEQDVAAEQERRKDEHGWTL